MRVCVSVCAPISDFHYYGTCALICVNGQIQYFSVILFLTNLQGLGVDSHDDRSVFKREIKNLKPFADKQKKVLEKQRKEEKKNAKKKKK